MSNRPPKLLALPGGHLMAHMRANRIQQIFDIAFEQSGGVERLVHEMNRSPEGYWEGVKQYVKTMPKTAMTESHHQVDVSIEGMWDRVAKRLEDRKNGVEVIDVEPTEVTEVTEIPDSSED